ncbi:MAG: hypothetical protein R6X31_11680 [Anaerolineae bacterium]
MPNDGPLTTGEAAQYCRSPMSPSPTGSRRASQVMHGGCEASAEVVRHQPAAVTIDIEGPPDPPGLLSAPDRAPEGGTGHAWSREQAQAGERGREGVFDD